MAPTATGSRLALPSRDGRRPDSGDPTDPADILTPAPTDTTLADPAPYSHGLTSFEYLPDAG